MTLDIGVAGNDRLILCSVGDESKPGYSQQATMTVDGKSCTFVHYANNPNGNGSHLEVFAIDEAALGSSNGVVTIAAAGWGDSNSAVMAICLYDAEDDTVIDWGSYEVNEANDTPVVQNVTTSNDDDIVAMFAHNGGSGAAASWTSPLTEVGDGSGGSQVWGCAWGIEPSPVTNKSYQVTIGSNFRSTAIVAVFASKVAAPPAAEEVPSYGKHVWIPNKRILTPSLKLPNRLPSRSSAGLKIDYSHPWGREIISAFVFGGYRADELVRNERPLVLDGARTADGINPTGTDLTQFPFNNDSAFNHSLGFLVCSVKANGTTPNASGRIIRVETGTSGGFALYRNTDTALTFPLGGSYIVMGPLHDLWDGNEHILAAEWRAEDNYRWVATMDMNFDYLSDSASDAWTAPSVVETILFGNTPSGLNPSEMIIKWCYFWRKIPAPYRQLLQGLAHNPYQVLAPKGYH